MFAGDYAPQGWLFCKGQSLPIREYEVLFSIIGSRYGSDGRTTFALPNLQGTVPIGVGQQAGSNNHYTLGAFQGTETTSVTINNLPAHTHKCSVTAVNPSANTNVKVLVSKDGGTNDTPAAGDYLAAVIDNGGGSTPLMYITNPNQSNLVSLGGVIVTSQAESPKYTGVTDPTGNGLPISILQPSLALNFIICVSGIYPPRP